MAQLESIIRLLVTGVGLGSLYALVAMGFAIIYKSTGVLNFAQGQIALVGAYAVIVLSPMLSVGPSLLVILLFAVLLGFVLERLIFRQFIGEPIISVIIVTLALGSILDGTVRMVGSTYEQLPAALLLSGNISLPVVGGIRTTFALGSVLAILTVLALTAFFRYTVLGASLQAAASDQQAALALGISIKRSTAIAWIIGIVITFVGGILFAIARGGAAYSIEEVGIIILAAVVIGGLDSIKGAFVGSLIVGILSQFGQAYAAPVLGPGIGNVLPLVLLLLVLLVKPYGLWGTERIERL